MIAVTGTPEVVVAELQLDREKTEEYMDVMCRTIVIEFMSYYVVAGHTGIKKGPARFLELFLAKKEDLRKLLTYLVHTGNTRTWIYAMCAVFDRQNNQKL